MATSISRFYGNGFYGPLIVHYVTFGNDGDCTYKLVIHHGDSIEGPVVETFDNYRSGSSVYFSNEAILRLYSYTRNEKLTNLCAAIETWKDGTKIGTTRGLVDTFMWDNAHPIITASVVDINEKTVGLTGDSEILVRYCSNAKATMTARGQKGAAIDENLYIIRNGNDSGYGTTHTFENVEDNEFIFSAEDSRGLVGQKTLKPTMVDYIKPTCNIANNKPDALGNMTVVCNGQYFNDSFGAVDNTLTVKCQYYEAGTTPTDNWIEMTVTKTGNSYIAYANFVIPDFDQQKYYKFEALASDEIYNISSAAVVKSMPVFHWGENDFVFEVPVTFNAGVSGGDVVVEQGEKSGWTYRKWSSGWAECWKTFQTNVAASDWTSWGTLYTAPLVQNATLPFTFVSNKREFATIHGTANGFLIGGAWLMSQTTTGEYYVCSPTNYSSTYGYLIDICVVGMVE